MATDLLRRRAAAGLLMVLLLATTGSGGSNAPVRWFSTPPEQPQVALYLFWAESCPHCLDARDFLAGVDLEWLHLEAREVSRDAAGRQRFFEVAEAAGDMPRAVPAFYFCGQAMQGFDRPDTTGARLLAALEQCYEERFGHRPAGAPPAGDAGDVAAGPVPMTIDLPLGGRLDPARVSLPALTVLMAALDSVNPCAFFVLLFLLSLLIHTRSRRRMLLVGGTFVLVSGLVYFLFMSAWLGLFSVLGHLAWLTTMAGALAVAMGLLNIKDFASPARGPSLGISEGQRASLFARIRGVLGQDRTGPALAGTILLALAANSYELLCTAGFPMVYTRILTLAPLSRAEHVLYLVAYNLVYVLPLGAILLLYVHTLGRRRLSEAEGRVLKLLSGLMMFGLGLVLLWRPDALTNPLVAAGLALAAVAVAALAYRRVARPRGSAPGG